MSWIAQLAEARTAFALIDVREGCWCWTGPVHPVGLTQFYSAQRDRWVFADSYVIELLLGERLPPGYDLRNTCDQRACIRPGHVVADPSPTGRRRGLQQISFRELTHYPFHLFFGPQTDFDGGLRLLFGLRQQFAARASTSSTTTGTNE